jgi:hypothetical protein
MLRTLAVFVPLIIMLCCTYLKYDRSRKQIPDKIDRKNYRFLNSTEFQDAVIQVAIVFLGVLLAMRITEFMNEKAEYSKAEAMMESLYFSHISKFSQIFGEINDLDVQSDMEKELDVLAKSVSASSSLLERESLLNDYMISTLTPVSMMQIGGSYENIDRCIKKLEIVESKKDKTELIAEYCYYNCVLGFEYEVLRNEPDFELVSLVFDSNANETWEKSSYALMYSDCIDKLEESFNVDLSVWRGKKPFLSDTDSSKVLYERTS